MSSLYGKLKHMIVFGNNSINVIYINEPVAIFISTAITNLSIEALKIVINIPNGIVIDHKRVKRQYLAKTNRLFLLIVLMLPLTILPTEKDIIE